MMNHAQRWASLTALAGFSLILAALPAYADKFGDEVKGDAYFEVYGGYFASARKELDKIKTKLEGDVTYGVRGGAFFLDHWGVEATLGFMESKIEKDVQPPDETKAKTDTNIWLFEGTLFYAVNPYSKGVFTLGGGAGYVSIDIDSDVELPSGQKPNEGALALHASVSLRIKATPHFYCRPDVRYRFVRDVQLGAMEDENLDTFEGTLALGWKFW